MSSPAQQKQLGAYYTDPAVVRFLLQWGLEPGTRRVLDPSCGDGRFLHEAHRRGVPECIGCDLDGDAITTARASGAPTAEWIHDDFFALEPDDVEPADLVVGNPPFIRYQRFRGESRERALRAAALQGAELTGLTSSWAPFVLHATRFLRTGGRLAMVVPAEIGNTQYGRPTLRALTRHFRTLRLIALERNWFDDAQTEAHLLLAEGHGVRGESLRVCTVEGVSSLTRAIPDGSVVDLAEDLPLSLSFLPSSDQAVFRRWLSHDGVTRVQDLGRVGNGYVTGDNRFFHRTRAEVTEHGWPLSWLQPVARSARSLVGLEFTETDVLGHEQGGRAHHLVQPDANDDLLPEFLDEGDRREVPARYKCRVRAPWWRVPGVAIGDVLVPYMTGDHPHASVNSVGAAHTNSLHALFLKHGVPAVGVALSFLSSFTLLAWEILGRSYGGGVLKLEPTEMARLPLFRPSLLDDPALARECDHLLRDQKPETATDRVDQRFAECVPALTRQDLESLRRSRDQLRSRRVRRTRRPSTDPR